MQYAFSAYICCSNHLEYLPISIKLIIAYSFMKSAKFYKSIEDYWPEKSTLIFN